MLKQPLKWAYNAFIEGKKTVFPLAELHLLFYAPSICLLEGGSLTYDDSKSEPVTGKKIEIIYHYRDCSCKSIGESAY
jgi:hypothetical protein